MKIDSATAAQSATGMPGARFDQFANAEEFWLHSGASLLRSALALQRQDMADTSDMLAPTPGRPRAIVSEPAYMLAAMAVECALKAVIAAKQRVTIGGKLSHKRHNLEELARAAGMAANDDSEKDALREGEGFITSGRYHVGVDAAKTRTAAFINQANLIEAYGRLFTQAAEASAREAHRSGKYTDPVDVVVAHFRGIVALSEL
jgi:hypothetical protein